MAHADLKPYNSIVASAHGNIQHVKTVSGTKSTEEELFDTAVDLKVATATYAMHLPLPVRDRLFNEFDYLLSDDAWEPGDKLPSVTSYKQFLRWMIFTSDTSWCSLGISDSGDILVAWIGEFGQMTAKFADTVSWTHRINSPDGQQASAGEYTLVHFARQSKNFLEQLHEVK
ncbi:MAG TPA: hypothetical protein DIT93_09915 [Pelagibacterium sp.]|uniref:hypothetical protein n=1 Tax=uncultured Pelagibacterium sp. TaxID=1159875 RepID=UPI000C5B5C7D|nr:hypothetical protein [Pelagibacterium sp.]HCO55321.1 hypothetical protein [Pelagibacterium sp.]